MRAAFFLTVLGFLAVAPCIAGDSGKTTRLQTNIPAQDLGPALRTLAKERSFQIVYASQDVAGRLTQGASGRFTNLEALQKLLDGTGMTYRPLDQNTVTVTLAATTTSEPAQRMPFKDGVTLAALPEVEISAQRDHMIAMRTEMVKLEDEFFAEYNRLNTDDQFDISCQEVLTERGTKDRFCRPVFVDELQSRAVSDAGSCTGDSCHANLFFPPLGAILSKSQAYEKNILDVINSHPHLRKLVQEREAVGARYEALSARDNRGRKGRQSKPTDTLCTQEPDGTSMRMTFAVGEFALCSGLSVDAAVSAVESLPEVEINARRESLRHLRSEIMRLEKNFYAKYNQLNDDDQYDINCGQTVPTGSRLRRRECLPVFVDRATEANARAFLGGYTGQPASSIIVRKWPDFEKTLQKAIETHPVLQKLAVEHATMQKQYAVVRKLKFKGKFIVLD